MENIKQWLEASWSLQYTCQHFLTQGHKVLILGVPGILKTTPKFSRKLSSRMCITKTWPPSKIKDLGESNFIYSFYIDILFVALVWVYTVLESVSIEALNSSHFSTRCEKFVRKHELGWNWSLKPIGTRVGRYVISVYWYTRGLIKGTSSLTMWQIISG